MRAPQVLCTILVIVGCSRPAPPASSTSSTPSSVRRGLPSIALKPNIEFGIPDSVGGASAEMGRVIRLSSAGYAIADWDGQRMLVFDQAGQLVHVFGRAGSGPAEFRGPSLIQEVVPDTLLIWDPYLRRIVWLDASTGGSRYVFLGTDKLYGGAPVIGQLQDGRLLVEHERWSATHPDDPSRPSATIRLLDQSGSRLVDLASDLPIRNQDQHGFRFFGPTTVVATDGHRIFVGYNGTWRIQILLPDGHEQGIITRPWRPRAVTEADRAAIREVATGFHSPPGYPPDERFDVSVPAFGGILSSTDGTIWVMGFAAPYQFADSAYIFASDAQYLGAVALPKNFRPTSVGKDYILGKATRPDGDLVIRQYALVW